MPARHSAECTALRANTMPSAPASATGPRIQNATASPTPVCGAAGQVRLLGEQQDDSSDLLPHRVETSPAVRASVGPWT